MTDENTQDKTVYDLATSMAGGQQMSTKAQREVAAELLRVRDELASIYRLFVAGNETAGAFRLGQLTRSMEIEP